MSSFTIELIIELKGKQSCFKLLKNGDCEFDEFWAENERNSIMKKQLAQIQARLKYIVDLKYDHLGPQKFKELTGRKSNDPYKEYEIKTKNLRVYLFKDEGTGQIIVMGELKILRMRI
ncbi:MAG: hypothetical protein M3R17_10885 [Bacteroidota bacterium]|nr:hypothetical protein [Bacteroidota bacterium]